MVGRDQARFGLVELELAGYCLYKLLVYKEVILFYRF
jgi:hypothetical protein